MIYPSPFSANRYIVLNSGHTFHAADFQGDQALLTPVLETTACSRSMQPRKIPLAVEVVKAGIFDEFWRITD